MEPETLNIWPEIVAHFFEGLGIIIGIIAGTIITILVNKHSEKKFKKYLVKTLKFELDYNIQKLTDFLNELEKYNAAVLEGPASMSNYFGYFRFSDIFSAAITQLYQNGFLAQHLTIEQIAKLQDAIYDLQAKSEPFINQNIANIRQDAINQAILWERVTKPEALRQIRFWKEKFETFENTFKDIENSISKNC
jgi:DNA-binding transcriptional regulator YdaS (Cro superfamily)